MLRQAIGRRARLQIEMHGVARTWSGIVASVRALGRVQEMAARGSSRPVSRIRIVEATWLLRHRVTSRIFQDLSVPEVIRAVLAEHRITARFALERGYPAREYVTQYCETDLAFVPHLAVANRSNNNVSVLLGNGNGTFAAASNFAAGAGPFSIVAADLNADGRIDLATANYSGGNVGVLLNPCVP